MMEVETAYETLDYNAILTRLITREDITEQTNLTHKETHEP
jgi:hypothetical protein